VIATYEYVVAVFIRKMPKSVAVQLEAPPKGLAYVPTAFIRSEIPFERAQRTVGYPLERSALTLVVYHVSSVWLDKAKIPENLRFSSLADLPHYDETMKRLTTGPVAPIVRKVKQETKEEAEERDAFDDLFKRRSDEAEW
jgi:hypothetical protein